VLYLVAWITTIVLALPYLAYMLATWEPRTGKR
jgi:hypothetical protein